MSHNKVLRWFGKNDETQDTYYTKGLSDRPSKVQWQKPHETKEKEKELWKNNTLGKNFESSIRQRNEAKDKLHQSLPPVKKRDVNVDSRRFGVIAPFGNIIKDGGGSSDPVSFLAKELQKNDEMKNQIGLQNGQESLQPIGQDNRISHRESNYDKDLPTLPELKNISSNSSYFTFNNNYNEKPLPTRSSREVQSNSSTFNNNNNEKPLIPPKRTSRDVPSYSSLPMFNNYNEKSQSLPPKRSSREVSSNSPYPNLPKRTSKEVSSNSSYPNNERPYSLKRSSTEHNITTSYSSYLNNNERPPLPKRSSTEYNITFDNIYNERPPLPKRSSTEHNITTSYSSYINNNERPPLPKRSSTEHNITFDNNYNERPSLPKRSSREATSYSAYSNNNERIIHKRAPSGQIYSSYSMLSNNNNAPSTEQPHSSYPMHNYGENVSPPRKSILTEQKESASYPIPNNYNYGESVSPPRRSILTEQKESASYPMPNNYNYGENFSPPRRSILTEQKESASHPMPNNYNNNNERTPPPKRSIPTGHGSVSYPSPNIEKNSLPPKRISMGRKEVAYPMSNNNNNNNEKTPPPRRSISAEHQESVSYPTPNNEKFSPPPRRSIPIEPREANYNNDEKAVSPKILITEASNNNDDQKSSIPKDSVSTEQKEIKESSNIDNNEKPPIPKKSPSRFQRRTGVCSTCRKKLADGGYCTQWCQRCESRNFENKFETWTSGNDVIDSLVLESQLNSKSRFNYLEWIPFDRFKDVRLIGSGGFGSVYQAIWLDGPKEKWDKKARQYVHCGEWRVALRSLDNSENVNDDFFTELKEHLQCENNSGNYVIRCYGVTQDSKTKDYMLVVQYARNGDLRKYISKNSAGITWKRKLDILYGIATALTRIHSENLIHKNLHSGNVLINSYMTLISDLGLSQRADDFEAKDGTYGILPYVAPEILRGKPYTTAVDVYSFGTIMWELAFERKPFSDRAHDLELATDIVNGLQPEIIEEIPECYLELMKNCWDLDPFKRPSSEKLYTALGEWLCRVYNLTNSDIKLQFFKAEQHRLESAKQGTKSSTPDQIESPIESPTESPGYSGFKIFEHSEATFKSRFLKFESLREPTIIFTRTNHISEHLAVQEYIAAETNVYNVKYEMQQADNTEEAAEIYEVLQYW